MWGCLGIFVGGCRKNDATSCAPKQKQGMKACTAKNSQAGPPVAGAAVVDTRHPPSAVSSMLLAVRVQSCLLPCSPSLIRHHPLPTTHRAFLVSCARAMQDGTSRSSSSSSSNGDETDRGCDTTEDEHTAADERTREEDKTGEGGRGEGEIGRRWTRHTDKCQKKNNQTLEKCSMATRQENKQK